MANSTTSRPRSIPRFHLIEIHEQAWFPRSLRDAVTDALQFTFNSGRLYKPVVPALQRALQISGAQTVLDLCSGAGGPWLRLQRMFDENQAQKLEVRLSDKYPNLRALQRLHTKAGERLTFHPEPVDAKAVQPGLKGFRTMFTSFHHFPPDDARAILQHAAQSREGIAIFEVPQRRPLAIFLTFLVPIVAFVFAPFMRPFRLSRLFWTYLIPVVPFVMLFDGIVSCLRAYSPAELEELADEVGVPGYSWEAGEVRGGISPLPVTYLIGCPGGRSSSFES